MAIANSDWLLYSLANFIDNNIFYITLIMIIAYLIRKKDGLFFIIFSIITTFLAKQVFAMPRICIDALDCPKDFAFPSGHATLAFSLAILAIDKKYFIALLLFALFVSYTRILLGFHTDLEILASLAMALINVELWWAIWKKK